MVGGLARIFLASLACALSACAPTVQPSVAQFGTSVIAAQNAESAFIDALNEKQADFNNIHILTSKTVALQNDGTVRVPTDANPPPATVIPPDASDAINQLLKPLQAYGQAMEALSADTAVSSFDTNVDSLAKQSATFDANVLQPLGGPVLSAAAQGAVATAVNDIGNIVLNAMISKDVQKAAVQAQQPLQQIVVGLKKINGFWSANVPSNLSFETAGAAVAMWNDKQRSLSYQDRLALKAIWEKAAIPVNADQANKALDALVTANAAIASAGPASAKVQIETLAQAASDAYKAYKALASKQ